MTLDDAKVAYNSFKQQDPYPKVAPALLNKWDVRNYIDKVGMIYPFYENDLNGITYDVRLKGTCLFWKDDDGKQIEHSIIVDARSGERKIILEPNSIIFVTLEPYFQIPEYIALRYNFKIKQVYKGLLLGTGPIIDPGFHGYLSIPLHNLTKNRYTIKANEPLISIEFTKINPYKAETYPSKIPADFERTKDFSAPERTVKDYVIDALKLVPDEIMPEIENLNTGICNSVPSLELAVVKAKKESIDAVDAQTKTTTEKLAKVEKMNREIFGQALLQL
jgi:deoxycytidine triphosphate deaminase